MILPLFFLIFLLAGNWSREAADTYGEDFRAFLTESYAAHKQLGYKNARLAMYGIIYNSPKDNFVTCVYTGMEIDCPYQTETTNCNDDLNCEHVVPQSLFDSSEPMKSDLHHLMPAYSKANSARSNYPFDNIAPEDVSKWYGRDGITSKEPEHPGDYSKLQSGLLFDPRDMSKGRIARAIAYFFIAYPKYFDKLEDVIDIDTMLHWNVLHPPSADEVHENEIIEQMQGNRNPFVMDHLWLIRAYCDISSWGCDDFE